MPEVNIGETVKAHLRSGTYIGKVVEDRGDTYLVEVLAVLKHPLQGDLHNLHQTEEVFFHERKALAKHEKAKIKKAAVHPYADEIPAYETSLKEAVRTYRKKLQQESTAYHRMALRVLNRLEEEVYTKIYE